MSQFIKFKKPIKHKELLNVVEMLGWKPSFMSNGNHALSKINFVEVNFNKAGNAIGLTRYGANECDNLLEIDKLPIERVD